MDVCVLGQSIPPRLGTLVEGNSSEGNMSVNTVWAMTVMMMTVIAHTVLTIAMAVRQIQLSVLADLVRNQLLPSLP